MGIGPYFGERVIYWRTWPVWRYRGRDDFKRWRYNEATECTALIRFEAGTPNVGDVIANGEADSWFDGIGSWWSWKPIEKPC